MAKRLADVNIVEQIRELSNKPENVRTSSAAYYGMMSYSLTKEDVCEAIVIR